MSERESERDIYIYKYISSIGMIDRFLNAIEH